MRSHTNTHVSVSGGQVLRKFAAEGWRSACRGSITQEVVVHPAAERCSRSLAAAAKNLLRKPAEHPMEQRQQLAQTVQKDAPSSRENHLSRRGDRARR